MSTFLVNKTNIALFLVILSFYSISGQSSENFTEIFKQQRNNQGEMHFSKANEFFKDGHFQSCINKVNEFLFLFPGHSATLSSLKLLSRAYMKTDRVDDSIRTDLLIYSENPTTEEGLTSYLEAGKKYFLIGRKEEAKKVLEKVKNQLYSSKIAKDAEIELKQNMILEENGFQISEEISKD